MSLHREDPKGLVTVLVQLELEPTIVTWRAAMALPGATRASATAAGVAALARVRAEQDALRATLTHAKIPDLHEAFALQRTFNGVAFVTRRDRIDALRHVPGVRSVEVVPLATADNARSVPFVGAAAAWSAAGLGLQGEHIKVGIIDTGIDYSHADFGGSGDPAEYAANDATTVDDLAFPTAKVVGGVDLAGGPFDPRGDTLAELIPQPDADPMDYGLHGTHVAGSAAGYGVDADGHTFADGYGASVPFGALAIGPGVAPMADLFAIKIFGDFSGGSTTLPTAGVEWAVDPNQDGDFADRLDVVNLSLGGAFGTASARADGTVFQNAIDAGLVIVCSGGNAGDVHFVGSGPASIPDVISVAAVHHDGSLGATLRWTPDGGGPVDLRAGKPNASLSGPGVDAPAITAPGVLAEPPDGCTPFSNDVTDGVAIVYRGGCPFEQKIDNAAAAGAVAVVIIDNRPELPFDFSSGVDGIIDIPGRLITQDDGATLAEAVDLGAVALTIDPAIHVVLADEADMIGSFSSRGPTRGGNHAILKPDVAAPGVDIISALAGSGGAGVSFDGTSMAAPHVAGMMALLREAHPTWTPRELKALAMNTADHDVSLEPAGLGRMSPARVGAGRVDVAWAIEAEVLAFDAEFPERVSVSFATVDVPERVTETRTVRIANKGNTPAELTPSIDMVTALDGVAFEVAPDAVSVPAGGHVDLAVTLTADPAQMIPSFDPTLPQIAPGLESFRLPEHAGYLVLSGAGASLRVPLYATPTPSSTMHTSGPLETTGPTGRAELALAGTSVEFGATSLFSPFELAYTSPEEAPLGGPATYPEGFDLHETDYVDLAAVGIASDFPSNGGDMAATTISFAVITHGRWGTVNELGLNVYIRRAGATEFEHVLYVGNDNAQVPSDHYFVHDVDLATGVDTMVAYVDGMPPWAWTYLPGHLSNAVVLPVPAAALGLALGAGAIEYQVVGFGDAVVDATPILHYDVGHPGLAFDYAANVDVLGLPPGYPLPAYGLDLPEVTTPIDYDLDAARANQSGGVLMLHWLNAMETRGEVVPVVGLSCASDDDCPSPDWPSCDVASGICQGCVENGDCQAGERCDVLGSRACVADCGLPEPEANACNAGSYCNRASKACVADCRVDGAMACADGTFCSAASGLCVSNALSRTVDEPAGDHCPHGGVAIEVGVDQDGDGLLGDDEVVADQTTWVCDPPDGAPSLVVTSDAEASDCPDGGTRIDTGVDDDRDGTLDEAEIDHTAFACDGANGVDGANGANGATGPTGGTGADGGDGAVALVTTTVIAPGAQCKAGGILIVSGVDQNGDGVLTAGETTGSTPVCNGSAGADGGCAAASGGDAAALLAALALIGLVARRRVRLG
ncbi:MAG: S8 family serine peptidase [Myxococcota bacterium]